MLIFVFLCDGQFCGLTTHNPFGCPPHTLNMSTSVLMFQDGREVCEHTLPLDPEERANLLEALHTHPDVFRT